MTKHEEYEKKVERMVEPIITEHAFSLVDVEYVKEAGEYYLRVYIDKSGGITIDDCETVSRALSDKLDADDFIPDAYILEVSSPGLFRPIKKEKDYLRNIGRDVEIHLFKSQDGGKEFIGILKAFDEETVTLGCDEDTFTFEKKNISMIREYEEL